MPYLYMPPPEHLTPEEDAAVPEPPPVQPGMYEQPSVAPGQYAAPVAAAAPLVPAGTAPPPQQTAPPDYRANPTATNMAPAYQQGVTIPPAQNTGGVAVPDPAPMGGGYYASSATSTQYAPEPAPVPEPAPSTSGGTRSMPGPPQHYVPGSTFVPGYVYQSRVPSAVKTDDATGARWRGENTTVYPTNGAVPPYDPHESLIEPTAVPGSGYYNAGGRAGRNWIVRSQPPVPSPGLGA